MNLWTHYHAPDVALSPKPPSALRLALWWPLHLFADPGAVVGSAAGASIITGTVPWQVASFGEGLRWYAVGGVVYYAVLWTVKEEAELKYVETHMPPWLKNVFGL